MSAPPLPEVFGNYALGDFVEVVPPAAVSWLPQTTAWWWLGAAMLGFFIHRAWIILRRWYRNRYRREAARRLQLLAAGENAGPVVGELNKLLKLTAMAAYSREQVARLSGEEWVNFLNRQCPAAPFNAEQGQRLALEVYRNGSGDSAIGQQLLTASANWIREHENPFND